MAHATAVAIAETLDEEHLHIGNIAGNGDQRAHVDPEIGGVVEARSGREIGQILRRSAQNHFRVQKNSRKHTT